MQDEKPAGRMLGTLCGLGAVCIWASFIIASRIGVRTDLSPWDVAAIRFTVAGVLLLPYLLRHGLALDQLGWGGVAAIVAGCGAPLVLLVNAGLMYAPAAHAGALFPGVSPLLVALLSLLVLNEKITARKWAAVAFIAAGALVIVFAGGPLQLSQVAGDALFLCASLAWAVFTIVLKRAGLNGLHATAIAAVGSLVFYMPPYLLITGAPVFKAPLHAIALQAVVQGVLTAIVALLLYGRAVAILGATGGAAFVALTPVLTGLASIPILGEWPKATDWLSIVVISLGVYILSGGRLPQAVTSAFSSRRAGAPSS